MIQCVNGCFNASQCLESYDTGGAEDWNAIHTCICDEGWTGFDCSIAISEATCAALPPELNLTVFDNVWVNEIQTKHINCYLLKDLACTIHSSAHKHHHCSSPDLLVCCGVVCSGFLSD